MITATDLFCGAGGSSHGMTLAGVHVAVAANHWPTALATHAANHPTTAHLDVNLSQVDPRTFPATDILWASPSCTHHTRAQGKKRPPQLSLLDDPEPEALVDAIAAEPDSARATMWDVPRFAEVHDYRAIIVENVPEVVGWRFFPWWAGIMTDELGYEFTAQVLDSAQFGVPQTRRRWFGVFTKHHPVLRVEATGGSVPLSFVLDDDPGPCLSSKPRAAATMARIRATIARYPNVDQWQIPYYGSTTTGRPVTEPCGTLTTRDRHAILTMRNGDLHYRMLNRAEQARVQGFPDDWQWQGTATDVTKQIGNSVVPQVAEAITRTVITHLETA